MTQNVGTLIIQPIKPNDSEDTYPTHIDAYGQGGYRSVADNTERDSIEFNRQKVGMTVYVVGTGILYTLNTISNTLSGGNWDEFSVVTVHNDLTDVQGGGVGEYYHNTLDEYDAISGSSSPSSSNVFATINDVLDCGMTKSIYDPTNIEGDIFDMDNMVEGVTSKILTSTERIAISTNTTKISFPEAPTDGKQYSRQSSSWSEATNLLAITAMEWDIGVLGTVGVTLIMDSLLYGEFTATLPLTGTTTTISLTNLPTELNRWPVLHLITGATFDDPIWSGIDATDITLEASKTYNVGFQPVKTTSGWIIVATHMVTRADV